VSIRDAVEPVVGHDAEADQRIGRTTAEHVVEAALETEANVAGDGNPSDVDAAGIGHIARGEIPEVAKRLVAVHKGRAWHEQVSERDSFGRRGGDRKHRERGETQCET